MQSNACGNKNDLSLDISIKFNGRDYNITRDKNGSYLKITGYRRQYDLTLKDTAVQCPYVERIVKIDQYGKLGKKILTQLELKMPNVFQKCQEACEFCQSNIMK